MGSQHSLEDMKVDEVQRVKIRRGYRMHMYIVQVAQACRVRFLRIISGRRNRYRNEVEKNMAGIIHVRILGIRLEELKGLVRES